VTSWREAWHIRILCGHSWGTLRQQVGHCCICGPAVLPERSADTLAANEVDYADAQFRNQPQHLCRFATRDQRRRQEPPADG